MYKILSLALPLLSLTAQGYGSTTAENDITATRRSFETPFIPCGSDPSGKGSCLVLNKQVYETLLEMPVGAMIEFKQFQMQRDRRAVLHLKRFSASVDGDDLNKVVLLRGAAFLDDPSSFSDSFEMKPSRTAFVALSPFGSNGFIELMNTTFILSTPWETNEKNRMAEDQYTASLRFQAERSLPDMRDVLKNFNKNHVTVIYDSSLLEHSIEQPHVDYILPPGQQEVNEEEEEEEFKAIPKRSTFSSGEFTRTFRVATDIDYQLFQKKGSNRDATSSYYYTLVGNSGSIYGRDFGSDFVSSYLRIYDYPDPYPGSSLSALEYMQRTWNPSSPSRSFAALLSAKNMGGGIAYLRTLCNTNYAYGVNGNMVGYYPIPVRSYDGSNWDIYVFLHEVGHIWGAQHTHELNPPVDYCGLSSSCAPTYGTIMSYCHLCQNGLANIDLVFHQRTKDQVRQFIGPLAC